MNEQDTLISEKWEGGKRLIALISDIHANFEALCAVMGDIRRRNVDSIVCLGDIVGYGPDPEKCADLIMQEARHTIMGNHDYALLNAPFGFNPLAAEVIRKTQDIMRPAPTDATAPAGKKEQTYISCPQRKDSLPCLFKEGRRPDRWDFFKKLPEKLEYGETLFVHGSPLDPISEYIFPDAFETAWFPQRIEALFHSVKSICFCGHTHIPCAIDSDLACVYPPQCGYTFVLDKSKKYIVNTGSVGQPRDRDSRACYCLFDDKGGAVYWRRVEYDIQSVIDKSDAMCGAGNWCGARLREGR